MKQGWSYTGRGVLGFYGASSYYRTGETRRETTAEGREEKSGRVNLADTGARVPILAHKINI